MERTKKITAALLAAATVITSGQAFLMTGLAAQQNSRTTIEDTQVPLYSKPAGSHVLTPIASGVTVYKNDKATLDASNTASGYIMVKYAWTVIPRLSNSLAAIAPAATLPIVSLPEERPPPR